MSFSLQPYLNLPNRILEVQMPGNDAVAVMGGLVHVDELSFER
jgi:hypothetical protein